MARSRKKKASRRQRPLAPARFAVGAAVRVKPGTADPDFPDIPLGAWAGIIEAVNRKLNPPCYLVGWNARTLEQVHPVYAARCERDGLELERSWLGEADLEPDPGDLAPIEQPTNIVARPLQLDEPEDRVRAVFGLSHDDPLPNVSDATLHQYHRYLAVHLSFPLRALFTEVAEAPLAVTYRHVQVVGLLDSEEADEEEGLLCQVVEGQQEADVPLACLHVVDSRLNRQLVEDYATWLEDGTPDRSELGGYLGHVPAAAQPPRSRALVRLGQLSIFGVVGGLYGQLLGAILGVAEQAALAAEVGAVLLALVAGVAGFRAAHQDDPASSLRVAPVSGAIVGAVLGALAGALAGAMLALLVAGPIGALIGSLLGVVLMGVRAKAGKGIGRALLGVLGGAVAGSLLQAVCADYASAVVGAMYGAAGGAIGAMLLWLAGLLLPPVRRRGGR